MDSLLKLLPMMIRLSGDHEAVREQAAFTAWRVTTGEQLAHSCRPFRLYRKNLVISVTDGTWKKQMESMSGQLIFRLNSLFGQPLVTLIEFRIDPRHVASAGGNTAQDFQFRQTQEIEAELKPAADRIRDDELRNLFLRAAAKYLERGGA
jgi:hypothetical protein